MNTATFDNKMATSPNLSNGSSDSDQSIGLEIGAALDASSDLRDDRSTLCDSAISECPVFQNRFGRFSAGASEMLFLLKFLWASPWSLWGLGIGVAGLLTGGGMRRSGRILEFWGGVLPLFLKYSPFISGSPVASFGYVVLGRCPRHLDVCRPHQLIHVKQYECWGPLFVPTYLTWWFVLWCLG